MLRRARRGADQARRRQARSGAAARRGGRGRSGCRMSTSSAAAMSATRWRRPSRCCRCMSSSSRPAPRRWKACPRRRDEADPVPEEMVREAPAGAAFVVLTHDHALDFLIVAEALKRKDAAYVGMIGSKTKKATFRSWYLKIRGRQRGRFRASRLADRRRRREGQAAGRHRRTRRRRDHDGVGAHRGNVERRFRAGTPATYRALNSPPPISDAFASSYRLAR